MQPYLSMEDYNMETAKKVSGDVAGLCSWTQAMAYFFGINKEVLPLKANLVIQQARLATAEKDLDKANAQLAEKQKELDIVQAIYDKAMAEKQVCTYCCSHMICIQSNVNKILYMSQLK